MRDLFFRFLRLHLQGEALPRPELPEGGTRTLPELELYCRKLDLYFSFAKAFGCPVDEEALYDRREEVAEEINEILLHRLKTTSASVPCAGRRSPSTTTDGCARPATASSGGGEEGAAFPPKAHIQQKETGSDFPDRCGPF